MRDKQISTIAMLICAFMASVSWWYNRELSKGTISLTDVKVHYEREGKDKVHIKFQFVLKNTGRETVKLSRISLGHIDVDKKDFEEVGKEPVVNPMHSESVFTYRAALTRDINPEIPDKEIRKFLLENVGRQVLILKLEHKGTSLFSFKQMVTKYFLGYEPRAGYYQLNRDEYEEIGALVPISFRVDE